MHHLFLNLVKRDGAYDLLEKAVHMGAYESKDAALERLQNLRGKLSTAWLPAIVPDSVNPIDTLIGTQKTIHVTGAGDLEIKTAYPGIDWTFEHPKGQEISFDQWKEEFLSAWQSTAKAKPVEASSSKGVIGEIKPDTSAPRTTSWTPAVATRSGPIDHHRDL